MPVTNNAIDQYLNVLALMYADDTVMFSSSAEGLHKGLDDLYQFCQGWKLTVTEDKTKVTILGSRKAKAAKYVNFHYPGRNLEIVDSFKYLGILTSFNGNFNKYKKVV